MRNIKFRCWNAFSRVMHPWEEMVKLNKIHLLDEQNPSYKVMQFTGLQDKNGVEIYEGDKIQSSRGTVCTVEFKDCAFQVAVDDFHVVKIHSAYIADNEFEVIGNIHGVKSEIN